VKPSAADWLQFTHLEKLYGDDEYEAVRRTFEEAARAEAERLRQDPEMGLLLDRLPFADGHRVLAVGDSITDDLQSWAEILRHLLAPAGVAVINAGLSAHTSAMVLRRWPAMISDPPDWILCGLGGNDVTRVGADARKPQVSIDETVANLGELRRIAAERSVARWVWLTPVPVDEARVAAHRPFQYGQSSWRNTDISVLAGRIREFDDPVVDLVSAIGDPPDPELQGLDGVHPSLAGQSAIATAVLHRLAELSDD
jgi:lysophospholipase L1-like esterase